MRHTRTVPPLGGVIVAALLAPLLLIGAQPAHGAAPDRAVDLVEDLEVEVAPPAASGDESPDRILETDHSAAPTPFGLSEGAIVAPPGATVEVRMHDPGTITWGRMQVLAPGHTRLTHVRSPNCPSVSFALFNMYQRAEASENTEWGNFRCALLVTLEIDDDAPLGVQRAGRAYIQGSQNVEVHSSAITLNVVERAEITEHPDDTTVVEGHPAAFGVTYVGAVSATSWQVSADDGATWRDVDGATDRILTTQNTDRGMNDTQYRAVLTTEQGGFLLSDWATLRVRTAPYFVEHPPEKVHLAPVGEPYLLSARASETSGSLDESVRWESTMDGETWEPIGEPESGSRLTIPEVTAEMDGMLLRALVETDLGRAVSTPTLFTVDAAPVIAEHPSDVRTVVGGEAVFAARTPAVSPDRTQQWQERSGDGEWTDLAGATEERLTIESATSDMDQREFRIVFANHVGTTASEPARLTVHQTPPQARISTIATVRLVDRLP